MKQVSGFMIVKDEQELVRHTMESFLACDLELLSVVDNGSTDKTLDIIQEYAGVMNIVVQVETNIRHHGALRTMALSRCPTEWVFYLDGDETCSADMPEYLANLGNVDPSIYTIRFPKYWTIQDKYHYIAGSQDWQCRLFRNTDGVMFNQRIHTEPVYGWGNGRDRTIELPFGDFPYIFDHTSCKSQAALLNKGQRYQWAKGEAFIGGETQYVDLTNKAISDNKIVELPDYVRAKVKWGVEPHA